MRVLTILLFFLFGVQVAFPNNHKAERIVEKDATKKEMVIDEETQGGLKMATGIGILVMPILAFILIKYRPSFLFEQKAADVIDNNFVKHVFAGSPISYFKQNTSVDKYITEVTIAGTTYSDSVDRLDCRIVNGVYSKWDWNVYKMRHNPGVTRKEVESFIDEVDIVILSRGVTNVLNIPQETIDFIKSKNKKYYTGLTHDVINTYNEQVGLGKKVGVLLHFTC